MVRVRHRRNKCCNNKATTIVTKLEKPTILPDGTILVTCTREDGLKFLYSSSKDGWTTQYRVDGAKEKESFYGSDGVPWFTWHYAGSKGDERGVIKTYHEGDGVHAAGTTEWYRGLKGKECLYFTSKENTVKTC